MRRHVFLISIGLILSGVVAAQATGMSFDISGASVQTNQTTGVITVVDAEFPLSRSPAVVTASKAIFVAPKTGNPASVKLVGEARITLNNETAIISGATYYPELDELTGNSIQFLGPGNPVWTCQGGIIFKDGTSTGQTSMCQGSAEVTCTASGNRVKYISSSSNCP